MKRAWLRMHMEPPDGWSGDIFASSKEVPSCEFVCVVEPHADDRPHYHAVSVFGRRTVGLERWREKSIEYLRKMEFAIS